MQYVLTMAAATVDVFPVGLADDAAAALRTAGGAAERPHWLGPAACDLLYDGIDLPVAYAAVRTALDGKPIDLIGQKVATRRKRLLMADMESTLIQQEMLDELAKLHGIGEKVAAVTARAMNGEIDFREALEARVALLAGLPISTLHDAWERTTLMPGAKMLVATMRRHGARTVLVSGGFTLFTAKLKAQLGFDAAYGNELEFERGAMTGKLLPPIRDKADKLAILQQEMANQGLDASAVLAVGDGANDLPMLNAAGLGVAYHAKPVVREGAQFRVDHADLSTLLYAQGYRREEFRNS